MALRPDRLARLAALIDDMQALSAPARAAWLAQLAAADEDLRQPLQALLDEPESTAWGEGTSQGGAGDTLWRQAPGLARRALERSLEPALEPAAGDHIGPWRLISLLGRGGMGVVWRAERCDGAFSREVALKLPLLGPAPARLAERFARERDILAALAHPNIARLYDAGVATTGQPYMALELVQGEAIVAWADARQLGLRGRVELLLQVLQAVRHAHQHLVVHRDLKPSNIQVDAEGRLHLLDFGIARLLDQDGGPAPAHTPDFTEFGSAVMTPTYAAPEQVERRPVTTLSDVYSLGVVLCELLAGAGPYRPAHAGRAALEDAILNAEPVLPSQSATAEAAARRGMSLAGLRQALRGDLDAIAGKALRKQPAERYSSAEALMLDLQAWLDGRPVQARPHSLGYRLRKLVRRQRAASIAAALALGGVLLGSALALWQADVARGQAHRAERESDRALKVQAFLIDLFNEADPARAQGKPVSVQSLMARGEQQLGTLLADQPETAFAVRGALIDIHLKLGDEKAALPLAQAQMQQATALYGAASVQQGLAAYTLGNVLFGHGQPEPALAALDQALPVLAAHAAEQWQAELDAAVLKARVLKALRRPAESVALLRATLPRMEARYPAQAWPLIDARAALASSYALTGQSQEAVALCRQLAPLLDQQAPERAADVAEMRENLGTVLVRAGQWAEARTALERARDDYDRLKGPRNSSSVTVRRALVFLLTEMGDYPAAARMASDNLQRVLDLYGPGDGETAIASAFAVLPQLMTGHVDAGLNLGREAVRIGKALSTMTTTDRRGLDRRLAQALVFAGHAGEAVALLQALVDADRLAGRRDGAAASTLLDLSHAQRLGGQAAAAAATAAQAGALWQGRDGLSDRVQNGHARMAAALASAAAGDAQAARENYEAGLRLLRANLPPAHTTLRAADLVQVAVLAAEGQTAAAQKLDLDTRAALTRDSGVKLPAFVPRLP